MKDDKWFANIKWKESCLECHQENEGKCPNRGCAEFQYDEWGEHIPDYLYFDDGNNVAEYLEEKRKRMESANGILDS